jgi:DNA-binding transcriptional MocR family regulator
MSDSAKIATLFFAMKKIVLARGLPPLSVMSKLHTPMLDALGEAAKKDEASFLQYGHFGGYQPLREHIAGLFGVQPERVFVGNGSMDTLNIFLVYLQQACGLGTFVCADEVYDRPIVIAKSLGLRPQSVGMTPEGPDLGQAEAVINERGGMGAMYTIPWFDNPSGIVHSQANKAGLDHLAEKHGWLVIRDGAYLDLSYHKRLAYPQVGDQTIQTFSFSKTVSAAWHTGGIIVPHQHAAPFLAFLSSWRLSPVLPTQMATYELIASGAHQKHMETTVLPDGRRRTEHFNALMAKHLPESQRHEITGGHFWGGKIQGITEQNWDAFVRTADQDHGVQIPHHSGFMPLSQPHESVGYIRIPLFFEDPEIDDPLSRIVEAIAGARAAVA